MSGDLEECRRRLPFPELLRWMGLDKSVGPKADGTGSAHCPFAERHKHGDENKSFAIKLSPRTGHYYGKCFAACGTFDDVELIKRHFNLATFGDALEKYCEFAGVNSSELLPDWDACVDALGNAKLKEIAAWRGFSLEFLSRFKKERRIGWHKGSVASPVIDNTGKLVAIHCCRLHSKKWFYQPKGQKVWPFVIGELAGPGYVIAAESTWDGLDFLDKSGETGGVVISRGKEFGRLTAEALEPGKIVYALMQHDDACEHWLRDLCAAGKLTVKAVRVPEKFNGVENIHDLNDWTRAGATPDDLCRAMEAAEIVATPTLQNNGAAPADAREVDLGAERGPELEPEPEPEPDDEIEDFPAECLSDVLKNEARAISETIGVNLSMSAPQVIAFAGASLGSGIEVKTSRGTTRGNNFFLVCKTSGSGGSKTYQKAAAPFKGIQKVLRREFERDQKPAIIARIKDVEGQIYKLDRELKSKEDKRDRKDIRKELEELERELAVLKERRSIILYITNVTPQSLTKILASGDGTILHAEPDVGTALALIKGEGGTDKRDGLICPFDIWLKGYSGDETSSHRISSGEQYVPDPCISVLFIATPDKIKPLFEDARMIDGGLLPRFLVCNPRSLPAEDKPGGLGELPTEIAEAYESAIFAVVNKYRLLSEKRKEAENNGEADQIELAPYEIGVTPGAQKIITDDFNRFVAMCRPGEDRPFESRWTEQMIRIAIVLHVFRCIQRVKGDDGKFHAQAYAELCPIDEATMKDAQRIRDWFVKHQKRMRRAEQEREKEAFWDWLKSKLRDISKKVGITAREIYKNDKFSKETTERFLEEFRAEGKLMSVKRERRGTKAVAYHLTGGGI
jgi:hypothetical protein